MSFFKKLSSMFSAPRTDDWSYWVYVQCSKCGEKIRTRVDLRNDLSVEYGDREGDTTYFCRKVLIGDKCYQPVEVRLTFDGGHRLKDQQVLGGKLITEEEFNS